MSIVPINIGGQANDGNGQSLRSGGELINANFAELDTRTDAAQAKADQALAGLDLKVDKEAGKGLSQENFSTGEKNKLAGLQPPNFRGTFISLAALQAGVASPVAGDYADVDAGVGSDVQRYVWDVSDTKWVPGSGGGGPANTDALPEGTTNLYFTSARVRSALLAGLGALTNTAIAATDTVLAAFAKLQGQINEKLGKTEKAADSDKLNGQMASYYTAEMGAASAGAAGTKGLVPAPAAGSTRFLSSLGTWLTVSASTTWGSITGTLSAQTDLQAALDAKSGFGVGQTWQNMAGSRSLGTTYTNSTGKPIIINVGASSSVGALMTIVIGSVSFNSTGQSAAGYNISTGNVLIPAGSTYSVNVNAGTPTGLSWMEYRP